MGPRIVGLGFVAASALACGSSSQPASDTCTLALPSLPDTHLTTDGTLLRDSLGRVVFLRGVAAGGRSKFAPYVPFDYAPGQYETALASYMDHAASWGIDAMRVPFVWAALEPVQGQDDQDWLMRYDELLDAAWARGIYTVVDFHQDVYSEVYCGDGFPGWTVANPPAPHHDCPSWSLEYFQDPDVRAAFDAFWAAGSSVQAAYDAAWDVMIARYKDKPGVAGFEPINEPGWGTANESTFSATTLTDFYSAKVARLRAQAPKTLVFVDPSGADGVTVSTQLGRPTGDGIVFAPHFYPLSARPDLVQGEMQTWANVGASWNVPVFVGEFGVGHNQSGGTDYMTAHFAALDALGLGGAEWEYSIAAEEWNSETNTLVAVDGTEYPIAKAIQRPYARAVAGSGVLQAFDASSSKFTLGYTATTGITEVSLPKGAYPSGFAVAVSGACYDATSVPGRLLLRGTGPNVSLTVTAK